MGGQILTFFIGQCGCQIANASWELYCLEHSISPDGKYYDDNVPDDSSFYNLFSETRSGHFIPRSLFIDLEPTVLDEIKVGSYRHLFNPENLINSNEDASNNFARGFYSGGKSVITDVIRNTRKLVENCDDVQAFMIHHSFGGGTGSGFTSMLLEYLSVEYSKRTKVEFGVFPSPTLSVAVVEPYNAVLALHTPMENADVAAFFENESLYTICSNNLLVEAPFFTHLNRMAAQVMSGMTCSMRFEGPINTNIIDYQTNLVPYPRIHFPLVSFSPLLAQSKLSHNAMTTKEIALDAFQKENQMARIDPSRGVYMSCCMLFRGDVNIREVNDAISHQKNLKDQQWVDWCPTGYKIGINYQPMIAIPGSGIAYSSRSLTLLCNTTAVKQIVSRLNHKFMLMYSHKSFLHWYVSEGMEEDEFKEAFDDVLMLEKDFEVIEQTSPYFQNKSTSENNEHNSQNYLETENINISAFYKTSKQLTFSYPSLTSSNSAKHKSLQNLHFENAHFSEFNMEKCTPLDYVDDIFVESEDRPSNYDYSSVNKRSMKKENSKSNMISKLLSSPNILKSHEFINKMGNNVDSNETTHNLKRFSRKHHSSHNLAYAKESTESQIERIQEFQTFDGDVFNKSNNCQPTIILSDDHEISAYQKSCQIKPFKVCGLNKNPNNAIVSHLLNPENKLESSTLNFISVNVNIG